MNSEHDTLASLSDEQLQTFLRRVKSHHLIAFLRELPEPDQRRLLSLLRPRSVRFLERALADPGAAHGRADLARRVLDACARGDDFCIFCSMLAGQSPASFIYREDEIAAFMDLYPITPGHMLVIPTAHTHTLSSVEPAVAGRLMTMAQQLEQAIFRSDLEADGCSLVLADGGAAGQDIFHVHLHVIPRYYGDGFGYRFPSAYPVEQERAVLDKQAQKMRELLAL